ncbi:MAG: chromosome segregation protein SMC [Verrucomicrobiales bacterium]
MYLKSLHLQGFKSFADQTEIEFHRGVTAIVGPNGCGKSNVVDAIRWVLGETSAKALRGGEMADVIFGGTDTRKPHSLAEVSILLGDCEGALRVDFNEVSIGRRVFRDGHGEYLINNQPCRLRDIHEMLMDTGIGRTSYSIMEQGKIDMLLSSKPEDRRAVFEEAAGITKFKSQKKEALRKLEYTEVNLLRVADIIAEVKRQMGSLQRQAAKARRFKTLLHDLKTLDAHLSNKRCDELNAEKAELEVSIKSLRNEHGEIESAVTDKEAEITEARNDFLRLEGEISDARQKIASVENEVQAARNRIGFNEERSGEHLELIEQNSGDIGTTEQKLSQQELDLRFADDTLAAIERKVESYRVQLEETSARHLRDQEDLAALREELGNLSRESNRAESEIVTVKARIQNLVSQSATDGQRREQLDQELARLMQEQDEKSQERERLTGEISEHRRTTEMQEQELIVAEKEAQAARNQLEILQASLREMHRALAERQSRLDVLEELVAQGEGFQEGTQAVMRGLNQPERYSPAIRGVLASFVEVEPEFAPAIEAALGRHLQTVLISDSALAEEIIANLTREKLGEALLTTEDLVAAGEPLHMYPLPQGGVAWALSKVRVPERVQPLIEKLLKHVLIVPDLRTALNLKPNTEKSFSFATLSGEYISAAGVIRGGAGSENRGSVLQRQTEIRQLGEECERLRQEVASVEAHHADLESKLTEAQSRVELTREHLQNTRVNHSTMEGELSLVARELQQSTAKIESEEWELREVLKRAESAEGSLIELRARHEESTAGLQGNRTRAEEVEKAIVETTAREAESARNEADLRTSLAVEQRTHESLAEQRLPMTTRVQELEELLTRRRSEIQVYHERIAQCAAENERLSREIEINRETITGLEAGMQRLEQERATRSGAVTARESDLAELRRRLSQINEQRGNEEIQTTQLDLRIENLNNIIQQRYQIHLDTFEPDSHTLLASIENQKKAHQRKAKRRATMEAQEAEADEEREEQEDGLDPVEDQETEAAQDIETAPIPGEIGPDWAFVKKVVGELKARVDAMGPVNIDAIEEFDELEERHRFLEEQHSDLVNSKEELLRVIDKINRTTRKMFAETFESIRINFRDMFSELFGKGAKADLVLLDESDPLESGIDITAKPPGKKLQSIALLSGGERSMTAVALLFAIYMVKPSPFCVLDELDAPLDEANIGRFLKVLDRFIDESQFIVITHNKKTMNRADVLYGVTMEEFGVSKRIGMKLSHVSDAPAAANAP